MSTSARRPSRPAATVVVAALCALTVAGCGAAGGAAEVAEPHPAGAAAEVCRRLTADLPARVDGQERGALDHPTPYAAVWGDPAIVLRCGVPRPERLTPGSASYDPLADAVVVNQVSWLLEEQPDGVRFTTTERTVFVELTVPGAYTPEVNALVDLAAPVDRHIPRDPLHDTV